MTPRILLSRGNEVSSAVDWDGGIKVGLLELRGEELKKVSLDF